MLFVERASSSTYVCPRRRVCADSFPFHAHLTLLDARHRYPCQSWLTVAGVSVASCNVRCKRSVCSRLATQPIRADLPARVLCLQAEKTRPKPAGVSARVASEGEGDIRRVAPNPNPKRKVCTPGMGPKCRRSRDLHLACVRGLNEAVSLESFFASRP